MCVCIIVHKSALEALAMMRYINLRFTLHYITQPSYTTQHRTVLIILPLILQTIVIAQMMSTRGEWERTSLKQSFTVCMLLLMATNALELESRR